MSLNLNPCLNRSAWRKLLIPQRIKKCPLNLRVKLRFFETPVKPVSCPMHPRLNHGFRLKSAFFAFIFLISIPLSAHSAVVEKIYELSLPVVSQQEDIRRAAFEQAFIEVLVRVSGSSLASTAIDVRQASRYVQQYRYLPIEESTAQQPATGSVASGPQYKLWVQFNEAAIKTLLRDNALPIWGQQRPSVLLWLAVRDGKNRYVLRQQDSSPIKDAVASEARRRGLPVSWPRMDQQDRQLVGFADVWGAFWDPVVRASQRYPVDAVMIGRMNWQGDSWQVNWSLMLDDKTASWKLQALDLELLMASGIDVATDQIASRFSVLENVANEGELVVQINGVQQLDSYARVAGYLRSLAPVRSVYVAEVDQHWVRFHLDLSGDRNDLQRNIALGKTLVPDTPALPSPVNPVLSDSSGESPRQAPVQMLPVNLLTYKFND
jgi:hypothetical protein